MGEVVTPTPTQRDLFHQPVPFPAELAPEPPPLVVDELLEFVTDRTISNAELRVLLTIVILSSRDGECSKSVRQLAAAMGWPRSSVGDHVAALVRAGKLEKVQLGGYRVRVSRTRPGEPDNPSGLAGQSVRVSRTPTPPKGGVGRARAARSKAAAAAPERKRSPAAPRGWHDGCASCDGSGYLRDPLRRCPEPPGDG